MGTRDSSSTNNSRGSVLPIIAIVLPVLVVLVGAVLAFVIKIQSQVDRLDERTKIQGKRLDQLEQYAKNLHSNNGSSSPLPEPVLAVFSGGKLTTGFDMGVDTSEGKVQWVTPQDGYMRMEYPQGQQWGAVFITVGQPTQPPRPGRDFSGYKTLLVELRGRNGNEYVGIGLKDRDDPDDGTEDKHLIQQIPREWTTYEIPLDTFNTADLRDLYVVTEFVFGRDPQTIDFRKIEFLSRPPQNQALGNR